MLKALLYNIVLILSLGLTACASDPMSQFSMNDRIAAMAQDQQSQQLREADKNQSAERILADLRSKKKFKRSRRKPDYYLNFKYSNGATQLNEEQLDQLDDLVQILAPAKAYGVRIEFGPAGRAGNNANYVSEQRILELQRKLLPYFKPVVPLYRKYISNDEVAIQFTVPDKKRRRT